MSEPDDIIDIAIIGGGIGGAAAAVAFGDAGLRATIYEQAHALAEVGGAIIIRDPSIALFARWGIRDTLLPAMVKIREIELRTATGDVQGTMPIQFVEGEGEYAYSVHRADVHNALIARIAPEAIVLDRHVKHIEQRDGHAEITFDDDSLFRARLVVGADGLRSVVRATVDRTPMTFQGMVTHRTIAPAALLPNDMPNDRIRMWMADRLRVMILPIRGGEAVAIDAVIPTETPPDKLWASVSDAELLAYYADFDPLITKLIEARTVDVTTHPVYDKDPIEHWTNGRVVLLGDAAHPMTPMQGQGANQAIQDAGALAAALKDAGDGDIAAALSRYEAERAPVTARLQIASRKPPTVQIRKPEPAGGPPLED